MVNFHVTMVIYTHRLISRMCFLVSISVLGAVQTTRGGRHQISKTNDSNI